MNAITTITLLKYKGIYHKFWALQMMQNAKPYLKNVEGLSFYKLLGSGQDGFKPQPDWSVYALLQVWKSEDHANSFFKNSTLINKYKKHSVDLGKLYLKPIAAHGLWSGKQPFKFKDNHYDQSKPVAIITRASIKTSELVRFWKYVPKTQRAIENADGLIYTKGFGEFPIWEMATFSLWKNMEYAKNYAYKNKEHRKAITMTRKYDWYKEELFSRFQVYRVEGQWMRKLDDLKIS
jgi:spheroidene monooxygenase